MKFLSKPYMIFEEVDIYFNEYDFPTTKEKAVRIVKYPGRHTWDPIQVKFESLDEFDLGKKQEKYESDDWIIHGWFVTELDHETLIGTVQFDYALLTTTYRK